MCFDSLIGFFVVSLQSFFSRVVPLLKITWIPSFWSSLLKISENPFSYGTLKDFSKSIGVFCVFFPHQFYIFGECISERSCLQYLLESHLQWMYLSVPHCDLWFVYINHICSEDKCFNGTSFCNHWNIRFPVDVLLCVCVYMYIYDTKMQLKLVMQTIVFMTIWKETQPTR